MTERTRQSIMICDKESVLGTTAISQEYTFNYRSYRIAPHRGQMIRQADRLFQESISLHLKTVRRRYVGKLTSLL